MAEETEGLRAAVTILDRFTAPLHRFAERLKESQLPLEKLRVSGKAFSKELKEIGERTGFSGLVEGAKGLGEHLKGALERLTEMVPAIGALGAAAGAAGLVELATKAGELGEQLELTAIRTGQTVEAISTLHFVAGRAGIDSEKLDMATERLNRTLGEVAHGGAKDAAALLRRLHISLKDVHGQALSAADVLPRLFEVFKKNKGAGLREDMAKALFGGKAGGALIPMLAQGKEFYDEMAEKARHFGLVMSDSQAKAGHHFMETWKDMQASVDGLLLSIGQGLIPVLEEILPPITEWIAKNRQLITTKIVDMVKSLGSALRRIDWGALLHALRNVYDLFADIAGYLGPSGVIYGGLTLIAGVTLAPLIGAFGKLGWIIGAQVLPPLVKLTAALGANFVLDIGLAAESLGGAGLAGALGGLAAFIEATPIGWFITLLTVAGIATWYWVDALNALSDKQKDLSGTEGAIARPGIGQVVPPGQISGGLAIGKKLGEWLGLTAPDAGQTNQSGGASADDLAGQAGSAGRGGDRMPDQLQDLLRGLSRGPGGTEPTDRSSRDRDPAEIHVSFDNVPRGTSIRTKSSGAAMPSVSVGYSMLAT